MLKIKIILFYSSSSSGSMVYFIKIIAIQWNAEIRMFGFQTAPKSEQKVVPFPDVRISDMWAVQFVQFEIFKLS